MTTLITALEALAAWTAASIPLALIVGHVLRHGTFRGLLRRGSR